MVKEEFRLATDDVVAQLLLSRSSILSHSISSMVETTVALSRLVSLILYYHTYNYVSCNTSSLWWGPVLLAGESRTSYMIAGPIPRPQVTQINKYYASISYRWPVWDNKFKVILFMVKRLLN